MGDFFISKTVENCLLSEPLDCVMFGPKCVSKTNFAVHIA